MPTVDRQELDANAGPGGGGVSIGLASKLLAIGGAFLVLALASIGLTLWVTWQLEGGAAAVNEAGRMRMRSYQLALILQLAPGDGAPALPDIERRLRDFDASIELLRTGDPGRPLAVPWDADTRGRFQGVSAEWGVLRQQALDIGHGAAASVALRVQVDDFVGKIDAFVTAIERHLSQWTTLLRTFQQAMMALAVMSALTMLYAGHVVILEPVARLQRALRRVEQGDFSARVQVNTRDELGVLAAGFNSMAQNLEALYGQLESKVREKTAGLEVKQARLSALYEVAAFVAGAETLEVLAQGFARQIRRIAGADAVAIRWSDEANARYVLLASDCLPEVMAREERCVLTGSCLCGAKVEAGMTPKIKVIPIQVSLRNQALHAEGQAVRDHCDRAGYTTLVTVPLGMHARVLGEIELFFRGEPHFSEEERGLFEVLANHLAGAMESLRASAMSRESAVAGERQLLAQELHDSIAQSLAFLKIQMQLLRDAMSRGDESAVQTSMSELDAGVLESYSDVRELLLHFRVRTNEENMEPALRETLTKFEHQSGLLSHLTMDAQGLPLPADVQIQVLHIVQEALSNVRKHSRASQAWVEVQTQPVWCVTVRDDGRGFDTQSGPPNDTHVGLRIMNERAKRVGATLRFESNEEGTLVELRLPNLTAEPTQIEAT
ncbi:type IV pili methyl-accepting chemotaxis transducer N-terminal domain-containing protein [Aquabacterium sp.]|uniref:type IV pili methyl-accepting chemotaxis transducer N-terminal domain-containing protein n=1 Tax=Aquabacterium sp. TaxID=1872578 RepID=UPI0024898C70|nr:type IV pili methyl-accepting chemotaxis transducer N-terminal domain-containing protein [Aquabacterium sp.]MDI1261343.1 type IV pili methyl-accepting chemotaxis transducer N-terminal domain-containing protein [Aquabacterium sp.]